MSQSNGALMTGYCIQVMRQSASPIEHILQEGRSIFVGLSDSCGIQIKGGGVEDIHCLIDVEDEVVSIQDWASSSGTKVNGQVIGDKTSLQSGDTIVLGSVTLKLAGKSTGLKKNADQAAANAAAEIREESVGMESMGYDQSGISLPVVAEALPVQALPVDSVSIDPQPASRLSDSFNDSTSAEVDDDLPECEIEEELVSEAVEQAPLLSNHDEIEDNFDSNRLTAADLDWDPTTFDDDQVDAEIVELLKSEIEDLRIQVTERDEQLAAMEGLESLDHQQGHHAGSLSADADFGGTELVGRIDDLLAELAEHDERVSMLQELLQTSEIQNQAEREERDCLETWVGEIEQRIGLRESEWKAERDALRDRLETASKERDKFQQQLHSAAQRYGKQSLAEIVPDETLQKLQQKNAEIQSALDDAQTNLTRVERQLERVQTEEPDSLQAERAELAQEKAATSRLRFQLSKQLQDLGNTPETKDHPDREFAFKIQTLREHLREIHEEEKTEREQKGGSMFGRISNLWKRVDDEN